MKVSHRLRGLIRKDLLVKSCGVAAILGFLVSAVPQLRPRISENLTETGGEREPKRPPSNHPVIEIDEGVARLGIRLLSRSEGYGSPMPILKKIRISVRSAEIYDSEIGPPLKTDILPPSGERDLRGLRSLNGTI